MNKNIYFHEWFLYLFKWYLVYQCHWSLLVLTCHRIYILIMAHWRINVSLYPCYVYSLNIVQIYDDDTLYVFVCFLVCFFGGHFSPLFWFYFFFRCRPLIWLILLWFSILVIIFICLFPFIYCNNSKMLFLQFVFVKRYLIKNFSIFSFSLFVV